jgi:hypothetical protein
MESTMSRFSTPVFLSQLIAVPILGLVLGLIAVELFDLLSGTRGNQLTAWACYALVGFLEGYFTQKKFPQADRSGARFIWIAPVSLLAVAFLAEFRRDPESVVRDFLILDPYSASRGLLSGWLTMPAFTSCLYPLGIWTATRAGSHEDQ